MTPLDRGFYPAARKTVIDMGIVRRRKVDVATDIPARRIADVPVELEGALGTSVRAAERKLVRRLVKRYESAVAVARTSTGPAMSTSIWCVRSARGNCATPARTAPARTCSP